MKESYGEGLATHTGPESCGAAREGGDEAWTGERAGQVLSRERSQTPGRRRYYLKRKAAPGAPILRGVPGSCAVGDTVHVETPRLGTGRSPGRPEPQALGDVSGSPRTCADDERTGEVGPTRSTCEVPEQCRATGGGGDGGKGSGQREPEPAKRVPDTVPDRRAQCAGAATSGS